MARILVVDDEADIRFVVESLLVARGHSVATAVDGPSALQCLAGGRFDAVVLDIMMPGTSGLEVIDRIRADRRLRDLPVLVLSAASDAAGRARGLRHGADDYVGKPFDLEELSLRIERLVERTNGAPCLAGNLEFLGTAGVLDGLAQNNSAARLSIPVGDAVGEIAVANGRLAAASFGALVGSDAALALLDVAHGRFTIVPEDPDVPLPATAPQVQSLLLESAWLEDEIHKRSDWLPGDDHALEPGAGAYPASGEANEVPWGRVLEAIRARPGVRAGDLPAVLAVAPARLRLALALLIESGSVCARPPQIAAGGEGRLATLLSDLLLEVLFSGQDVDHLKVEILADPPGFVSAAGWLEAIPEELRDGPLERAGLAGDQVTARLQHSTGRAELVLRRVGSVDGGSPGISADALFCVLLVLGTDARARRREAQLLAQLAPMRPSVTAMVSISPAAAATPPVSRWRRVTAVPASLEELFERLLDARTMA